MADHSCRAKSRNVFARSNAGIVGSNPTLDIDGYLHFSALSCVFSGFETG
jgi:hypothetical protein